jgi:hypothetical protein
MDADYEYTVRNGLALVYPELDGLTDFFPYPLVFDGFGSGCASAPQPCGTLCTENGLYCRPNSLTVEGATGRDVLALDVFSMCLFQQNKDLWWVYTTRFGAVCFPKDFTAGCARGVVDGIDGLDAVLATQCAVANANTLLEAAEEAQKGVREQSASVEGAALPDTYSAKDIVDAICAASVDKANDPIPTACKV